MPAGQNNASEDAPPTDKGTQDAAASSAAVGSAQTSAVPGRLRKVPRAITLPPPPPPPPPPSVDSSKKPLDSSISDHVGRTAASNPPQPTIDAAARRTAKPRAFVAPNIVRPISSRQRVSARHSKDVKDDDALSGDIIRLPARNPPVTKLPSNHPSGGTGISELTQRKAAHSSELASSLPATEAMSARVEMLGSTFFVVLPYVAPLLRIIEYIRPPMPSGRHPAQLQFEGLEWPETSYPQQLMANELAEDTADIQMRRRYREAGGCLCWGQRRLDPHKTPLFYEMPIQRDGVVSLQFETFVELDEEDNRMQLELMCEREIFVLVEQCMEPAVLVAVKLCREASSSEFAAFFDKSTPESRTVPTLYFNNEPVKLVDLSYFTPLVPQLRHRIVALAGASGHCAICRYSMADGCVHEARVPADAAPCDVSMPFKILKNKEIVQTAAIAAHHATPAIRAELLDLLVDAIAGEIIWYPNNSAVFLDAQASSRACATCAAETDAIPLPLSGLWLRGYPKQRTLRIPRASHEAPMINTMDPTRDELLLSGKSDNPVQLNGDLLELFRAYLSFGQLPCTFFYSLGVRLGPESVVQPGGGPDIEELSRQPAASVQQFARLCVALAALRFPSDPRAMQMTKFCRSMLHRRYLLEI